MFARTHSPAKKKFAAPVKPKRRRAPLDPRTRVLLVQGVIGICVLSVLGLGVTGVWHGTRVASLTLTTVAVEGGETIDHERVVQSVQAVLEGTYVGVVPRRFAWWYPHDEVQAAVAAIPRIKNPQVQRVSGTALQVTFTEYIPHALWCVDRLHDTCVFIDEAGYAFAPAPHLEGGAFPRFHVIGTAPAVNSVMLPEADVQLITQLRERVSSELQLPIAFVETDMMRDVFFGVAGGGEIKVSLRQPIEETFSNLQTIVTSEQFAGLAPGNFQYIDLRFGSKVFVNNVMDATTTATSTLDVAVAAALAPTATDTDAAVTDVAARLSSTTASSTEEANRE